MSLHKPVRSEHGPERPVPPAGMSERWELAGVIVTVLFGLVLAVGVAMSGGGS